MACYHPITGWRDENGRITFTQPKGSAIYPPQSVDCGRCYGCRLEKSRQWAVRCMHEAQMHQVNAFLTLTYNDEHLPPGRTLVLKDWQDFAKRVRKKHKFRFFHCGEYGDENNRPHYHALLFCLNFGGDRSPWRKNEYGDQLYRSPELEKLWKLGNSELGEVTWRTASYVARYAMKKINGDLAPAHYQGRKPEYSTMSRNPGIAAAWIEKYETDVYPVDNVVVNGREARPPRYYDEAYARRDPLGMEEIKEQRKAQGRKHRDQTTPERLEVREKVARAKGQLTKRKI